MSVEKCPVSYQDRDQNPTLERHLAGDATSMLRYFLPRIIPIYDDKQIQVGFLVSIPPCS